MKKQLTIMVTCVLFLTIWCSGCEQFSVKPDHIRVNVMVAVFMNVVDENYNPLNFSVDGAEVTVKLLKSGRDWDVFKRIVQQGLCQVTYDYTLTQGESIECFAAVQSGYGNCYPVNNESSMLTWETASASVNYAGEYNWYPHITIIMMHD
jgi:hypothetical protein